jgi:hypothetical protein
MTRVFGYFPVAVRGPMLIEKIRPVKEHRSIGKPNQDAFVTTVRVDYMDGMWGDRHICHPRESEEAGLSSDERSTRSPAHVTKRTGQRRINRLPGVKCSQSYANA